MNQSRMQEIVDNLNGTCSSILNVLNEGEEETKELNDYIDQRIFECETCGWWCELSEMSESEEWSCTDCCLDD